MRWETDWDHEVKKKKITLKSLKHFHFHHVKLHLNEWFSSKWYSNASAFTLLSESSSKNLVKKQTNQQTNHFAFRSV